ncbi:MAG: NADP-dependent malic enzyme [Clostridia bacterium]|nr:NADP-dependent malic enzyme [Clostridia bacterium]MBQ4586803.1 NADP-dependent malic enzyme [Clostridia bacterium]
MKQTPSIQKHLEWKGKVETRVKAPVDTEEALALAYTPGVADVCLAIKEDINNSYLLTGRANAVAVITDGTAILGLGNIGPEAGMPVMEGKCALFKQFGGVDAIPLCLKTTDTEEIIRTIKLLEGSFGGINLEDISAPRCFEIETRLKKELDIPVFHDDQHGTAIVVGAALINALKVVGKSIENVTVVVNGAGAAGISIGKYLLKMGVKDLIFVDRFGIICEGDSFESKTHEEVSHISNKHHLKGALKDALVGADVFVGVSVGNIVTKKMVESMNDKAIVFAMANPIPEIAPDLAKEAGAAVVGTGSSKHPNQINNALVFPGLFRGALDVRASDINLEMMMAASKAIAETVPEDKLSAQYIIPKAVDKTAHENVAKAVKMAAINSGVARVIN